MTRNQVSNVKCLFICTNTGFSNFLLDKVPDRRRAFRKPLNEYFANSEDLDEMQFIRIYTVLVKKILKIRIKGKLWH